ncbi:TonB-dependent receptor [Sphingosinicella sp. LHD-64]|uniref:TonB-dependent receptor n=1 Tax=Sphingosinicella sp. LHD-64 TaxID=3072139 RepID=UPI00280E5BA5|nr:TonB-dependent receptor [Sphingosinicella sp. LHD-64]MDQ8757554.1 TonB-dependent receptor [Sphingosinicella sp. LHD-64]
MSFGSRRRTRQSSGWLVLGGLAGLTLIAMFLWPTEQISQRPNEMKTTRVILPPPPPPPPEPEPIEQETPPEPTEAPPLEEPVDTPPPPEAQSAEPTARDSALTAREGAGPSNYGLQRGDGSGTRIGSRPAGGDNGFAAYASVALSAIRLAAQSDRSLARGRYTVRLLVAVDAQGRISDVSVVDSSGEARRDARLRQILTGLQLSRRPPAGLPPMRIELNARSGA